MNAPDYLLPIMATAGVGHLTLDRSGTPSVGVAVPPKAAQASAPNIADFFESFSQAQDREAKVYQMDPLSSPNDLSPLHMATTPIMWMTPADMKIFLRPQDEALEDTWKSSPEDRGRRPSIS